MVDITWGKHRVLDTHVHRAYLGAKRVSYPENGRSLKINSAGESVSHIDCHDDYQWWWELGKKDTSDNYVCDSRVPGRDFVHYNAHIVAKEPSLQTPCIYGLDMDWYDGVHLKDRAFTAHERDSLERHARVSSVKTKNGETMGVKGTVVKRPMDLKLTHYHHMNALVALLSCHTDQSCESIICYPGREIRSGNPKWHGRPHVYQLYLHRHSCQIHAEGTADVKKQRLAVARRRLRTSLNDLMCHRDFLRRWIVVIMRWILMSFSFVFARC